AEEYSGRRRAWSAPRGTRPHERSRTRKPKGASGRSAARARHPEPRTALEAEDAMARNRKNERRSSSGRARYAIPAPGEIPQEESEGRRELKIEALAPDERSRPLRERASAGKRYR